MRFPIDREFSPTIKWRLSRMQRNTEPSKVPSGNSFARSTRSLRIVRRMVLNRDHPTEDNVVPPFILFTRQCAGQNVEENLLRDDCFERGHLLVLEHARD